MEVILAYPLYIIYLICFFFFPEVCSIILMVAVLLYWLYIFYINKNLKFKDDDFSEEEKKILYKYPLYFRYYFFSTSMSRFFAFVQITTILLVIFLLWKSLWLYLIPIVLTFFISVNLRMKLDPLFFKKEVHAEYKKKLNKNVAHQIAYGKIDTNKSNFFRRMENETKREIYLMEKIYDKFWNRKGKEKETTN